MRFPQRSSPLPARNAPHGSLVSDQAFSVSMRHVRRSESVVVADGHQRGAGWLRGLPAVTVLQELPPQPAESEPDVDRDVSHDNPEEEPQRVPQGWRRTRTAALQLPLTRQSERTDERFGPARSTPAVLRYPPNADRDGSWMTTTATVTDRVVFDDHARNDSEIANFAVLSSA